MYSEDNDFSRFVFCRTILAEVDFNPAIIAVATFRCDDRLYFALDSDDRLVRFSWMLIKQQGRSVSLIIVLRGSLLLWVYWIVWRVVWYLNYVWEIFE